MTAPLVWDYDGESYSPTGLAHHILREATGEDTHLQGTLWWVDENGRDLVTLAADLPSETATVEDIAAVAEANGLGEAFRLLLDAGRHHGLFASTLSGQSHGDIVDEPEPHALHLRCPIPRWAPPPLHLPRRLRRGWQSATGGRRQAPGKG